jgi:hypothetical protein
MVRRWSGAAIRPVSVVWYERLAWVAFATGLVSAAADPATLAKYYGQSPIFYPIAIACFLAMQLLWIWLIARKRQNWARWISVVLTVLAIPMTILDFDERVRLIAIAAIPYYLAFVIQIVVLSLLFRHDARRWFAGRPSAPDAGPPPQD